MSSGAAVNVPTNYKIKEQDVNNKLQLYGIYAAFANGKVPSNKQVDIALNSFLQSKALGTPSKKLSADGQKLVADFKEVVEQAKIMMLTKNQGNLIQDFIWQTQQMSGGNAQLPGAPIDSETAKQHGNQALEGLRTLGTLIISNGQFRKLLKDAQILARDIAGDAATKAAGKVNPGDDELSQIDAPADDNTWHEVPDLSKDNLKSQWNANKPFNKGEAQEHAQNIAQDSANTAQNPDGSYSKSQGLKQGASNLKGLAQDNIPQEHQDKAIAKKDEYRERGSNYLKEKMPKERREQTIWRLKKMIAEIQGHQDYQQAIETLLTLAEQYAGHAQNVAGQGAGTIKGAHTDDSLQMAETDLKTLIERFANSTSVDDLFDSINQIYVDANNDPELKNWFKTVDRFIRRCLQEQGYVLQDASTEEWNRIYDKGNFLLRERYRNHTDRVLDEVKFVADQFDKDPQNHAFGEAMQRLFNDLGTDDNGKAEFKPHLLKDLSEVILPAAFEGIRYVPIPRIEYSDPMIDAVVENLVLEGDNLAPNVFEFGSDNYWRWGRKSIASKNKNKVMLSVSGIQCDLRDVSYYIKKKEGFPGITDKGIMDIILGGSGLSFKVAMETADKTDRQHFFKVNTVDVSIKNMNIVLKKSNHKLLFKVFKPLLLKVMTPVIQKVVEKQVRDNIHQLDGIAYQIHQNAQRASRAAKNNPEEAPNVFSRYTNAGKDYMTQQKQKKEAAAKEKAADKQVNMAVTQHDSLFPNIKLPGGISTKATEYKNLAAKGDKWESPIFTIGSAKETSNLPSINPVTRKRNHLGSEQVRGNQNVPTAGNSGSTGMSSGPSGSSTGAGYGQSTGAGYGQSTGAGYGQSTGSGLTGGSSGLNNATSGYAGENTYPTRAAGTTGTDSGFRNEVDQAFQANESGSTANAQTGGTTLGSNNPVFTGRA